MNKIYAKNSKSLFYKNNINFEINAGLVLKGYEVKYIKNNKININNSYINIINNEIFLIGLIFNNSNNIINNLNKKIKLLLKKKEILILLNKIKLNKFIIIPILFFLDKTSYIKVKIGVFEKNINFNKKSNIKNKYLKKEKINILNNCE